jgi:hypothetical protein
MLSDVLGKEMLISRPPQVVQKEKSLGLQGFKLEAKS